MSEEKYADIVKAMDFASILGAKNIIVHYIKVPKGVGLVEYNCKFYKSLETYCEKLNIHITVQTI